MRHLDPAKSINRYRILNATNETNVRALIAHQDAVASFIGHVKGSAPDVQTEATKTLISSMGLEGVKRIISLTGTGVRFTGDKIPLIDRFLNLAVSIVDPYRVTDGRNHVEILKQSTLDWTVIRVLKLQNVSPKPFSLREHGPTKLYVSRDEVAAAALEIIEDGSFIKQAPIICRS